MESFFLVDSVNKGVDGICRLMFRIGWDRGANDRLQGP